MQNSRVSILPPKLPSSLSSSYKFNALFPVEAILTPLYSTFVPAVNTFSFTFNNSWNLPISHHLHSLLQVPFDCWNKLGSPFQAAALPSNG